MRAAILAALVLAGLALLVAVSGAASADPGHHEVQIVNGSGDVNASYYYDSSAGTVNVTEDGGNSWTNSTLSNPDESAKAIDWALGNVSAVSDTVLVGPGTYNGTVTVGFVTLTAPAGPSQTTLNPVAGSQEIVGINVLGDGTVVRNFTVAGYDSSPNVAIEVNGGNATVADNVVRNNRVGISDSSPDGGGNSYVNNTVVDNLASGVLIRANLTTVRDNRVRNNSGHGIVLQNYGGSLLRGNNVSSNGHDGIHVDNSKNNTLESNEILDNGYSGNDGVRITNGSDWNRIADSTIVPNEATSNAGVSVNSSHSSVVQNNSFSGGTGVEVTDSSRAAIVSDNSVISVGDDANGINLDANHSIVSDNSVQGGVIGIDVDARNVTLSRNDARDSTAGVVLAGPVHVVERNLVTNATGGFTLDTVSNSSFTGNNVSHNGHGITLFDATNNSFRGTVANDIQHTGIELPLRGGRTASSHGNVFENVTIRRSGNAAFYANGVTGPTNVLTNLDIGASTNAGTTIDLEAKNVSISSVGSSPGTPSNLDSIGRLVTVTNTSAPADTVNLTLHYEQSDLDNFDDSTLALYNHSGSAWTEASGASHDTGTNTFSATFTDYGVVGLYAESTSASGGSGSSGGGGYYVPPPSDTDQGSTSDTDGNTTDDTADDTDDDSTANDTGGAPGSETGDSPGEDADGESDDTNEEETPNDEENLDVEKSGSGSFPWWLLLLLLLAVIGGVAYYHREEIQEKVAEYRD